MEYGKPKNRIPLLLYLHTCIQTDRHTYIHTDRQRYRYIHTDIQTYLHMDLTYILTYTFKRGESKKGGLFEKGL